jgi:acyl carrier protein
VTVGNWDPGGPGVLTPAAFCALVARVADQAADAVTPDTPLTAVVTDSFAALELYVAIEDATGVALEWDPTLVDTVGDLYAAYVGVAVDRGVSTSGG